MPKQPSENGSPPPQQGGKKRGSLGCLLLLFLIALAFLWKCIPDSHSTWEAHVPAAPPPSNTRIPPPTDMPRAPMVPTYDVGYLRWAGTLQPGQTATWGGIALSSNQEIPVGGAVDPLPPCQVYGQVKLLAGPPIPFVIFDEPNFRRWREGGKASARAMVNVTSEQDYSISQSSEPQFLVLDNRKGSAEVTAGLTGIQSCLRPAAAGDTPFQAPPRPTATWHYWEETLTLVGYLLRLMGGDDPVQVMTPPEIL